MTVASSGFGRFGALEVSNVLEQRGTDVFLKMELSLAIVDGRHRRSITQKLADSGERGVAFA